MFKYTTTNYAKWIRFEKINRIYERDFYKCNIVCIGMPYDIEIEELPNINHEYLNKQPLNVRNNLFVEQTSKAETEYFVTLSYAIGQLQKHEIKIFATLEAANKFIEDIIR